MSDNEEFIAKSDLGTREYWDAFYTEEIGNFDDHGDEGESWFGKANTLKIVKWVDENVNKSGKSFPVSFGALF